MASYRPFAPPPPPPSSSFPAPPPPPQNPSSNLNPNSLPHSPPPYHQQQPQSYPPHHSGYGRNPNHNSNFSNPQSQRSFHHQQLPPPPPPPIHRSNHHQQHYPYSGPPPVPPQPSYAPPLPPPPPQNHQPPIYYSSSAAAAGLSLSQLNSTSLPPPLPPPSMPLLPPPPSSPPPPHPPSGPPPPQPPANHRKDAALPPKPPQPQQKRAETEEERSARKKREYDKQRAEERRQHMLKQSQATVLQRTKEAMGSSHGHHHHQGSMSGSKMTEKRTNLFLSGDRVENRLKKPTTFICKFKFRNQLPDPSAQPKLLPVLKDKDRYTRYRITSLEKNYKPKLFVEPDLGIPLDLLDLSIYKAPEVPPPLDPEDEELLRDTEVATPVKHEGIRIKERPTDIGVSWLVKTQYISPLSMDSAKLSLTEKQAKEMRETREGRNVSLENLNNREKQIQAIEESFKAAKLPPVHQTNPSLQPLEVIPLLPDFDRYDDRFVMVGFDNDPTADSEMYNKLDRSIRDEHESQAIMKSFVVNGSDPTNPEKFLAYMVPAPDELNKDIYDENEDVSYSWVREYHWDVRGDDVDDPTTYLVNFGDEDARYLPLPTKLVLKKKKAKEGRSGDEVEHYPVPSRVTVRKRAIVAVGEQKESAGTSSNPMEPGPISTNVLYQQSHHRSRKIESGEDPGVVTLINHARSHQDWPLVDARVRVLVGRAGFLACSQLSWIRLDWSLITALLERWRPETETFHLRVGEMTVTLQDVAVLLGLRIDGHPVTGTDDRIWSDVCRTGLGRVPPLTGGCIRLRWLRETFQQVPANAGANRVRWHARAYILHMIGTLLFPDSNKGTVHARWLPLLQDFDVCGTLSWGSAVLAYLYKELAKVSLMETKELHACITLLQAWSWEHIGVGRPALLQTRELNGQIPLACRWNVDRSYAKMPNREIRLYRNELDVMEPTQVIWEPYSHDVLQLLPHICTEGVAIWRARVPLICFEIIEMHVPDRVLRQFGLAQHIPDAIVPIARRDRQGRPRANWALDHACFAILWNQRADHIQDQRHPATHIDEYIYWYWGITRRWIITRADPSITYMPRGYIERDMISEIEQVERLADQGVRARAYNQDDTRSLFREIANRCRSVLQRARVIRPAPPRPPVRFVYTRQRRHLRLTDVSADVGHSQRRDDNALAIVTQPHTQPDPEILHAQRGGERRVPRMLACLR